MPALKPSGGGCAACHAVHCSTTAQSSCTWSCSRAPWDGQEHPSVLWGAEHLTQAMGRWDCCRTSSGCNASLRVAPCKKLWFHREVSSPCPGDQSHPSWLFLPSQDSQHPEEGSAEGSQPTKSLLCLPLQCWLLKGSQCALS